MDDIPEDISNKKYVVNPQPAADVPANQAMPVSTNLENDDSQVQTTLEPPSSQAMEDFQSKSTDIKIEQKDSTKNKSTGEGKKDRFRKYLQQKKKHFIEVQYPRLYARFYDAYNFNLVGYKPLDNVLKILMLVTALVLVIIFVIILIQLIKLAL